MKLSELIERLTVLKERYGDLEVIVNIARWNWKGVHHMTAPIKLISSTRDGRIKITGTKEK